MHGAIALTKKSITERALATVSNPMVPASFPLGRGWFVVCVWGGCEQIADEDISELGFETFSPRHSVTKIMRGRRVITSIPIFPGYLFVKFDREADNWGAINHISGVIGILENRQMPSRVPDIIIERLRNMEEAGVFEKASALRIGEQVEIMEGPFAGELARIKSATAKKRVKILLGMLRLEIDPCFLRKVR